MEYQVRNAFMEDLERVQEIYAYARAFMRKTGNPNQWSNNHPPLEQLQEDVQNRDLYVICRNGIIHGVFYFFIGEDPTYGRIDGGCWRSDSDYGTIHRIAGDGSGGILKTAVAFAKQQIFHIRIDTHEDNHVMQHAVAKEGFQKRGIIYIADGSPRIAYDLLTE
ncbi:MAG: N-acetyltransferase [Oscillospiraceae bacterium]|nr:N-acetyltransferase [Oscillospiraceae bacterium]